MDHKAEIHNGLRAIAHTMLDFIRRAGSASHDGWVPATYIKRELELKMLCYPKEKKQHGPQGWLFSILARMLEDEGVLDYHFDGTHAYYRAKSR